MSATATAPSSAGRPATWRTSSTSWPGERPPPNERRRSMRTLFLRHGESAANAHTGTEELGAELGDVLTERGRRQAEAAGEAPRDQGIPRLFTSPMRRATETAAAVGAALDLEPEPIPYAFELQHGETFAEGIERVHLLKERLEAEAAAGGGR